MLSQWSVLVRRSNLNFRGGLDSKCKPGYGGKLCASCTIDSDGNKYVRSGGFKCSKC